MFIWTHSPLTCHGMQVLDTQHVSGHTTTKVLFSHLRLSSSRIQLRVFFPFSHAPTAHSDILTYICTPIGTSQPRHLYTTQILIFNRHSLTKENATTSLLQHTTTPHCNTLQQRTATHYNNALQHTTATHCNT